MCECIDSVVGWLKSKILQDCAKGITGLFLMNIKVRHIYNHFFCGSKNLTTIPWCNLRFKNPKIAFFANNATLGAHVLFIIEQKVHFPWIQAPKWITRTTFDIEMIKNKFVLALWRFFSYLVSWHRNWLV